MAQLIFGDFAPLFDVASTVNPTFRFHTVGGRRSVLCFVGDATAPANRQAVASLTALHEALSRQHLTHVFLVSTDPADQAEGRLADIAGPCTVFWDFDLGIARRYGMVEETPEGPRVRPGSVLIDENLRYVATLPVDAPADHGVRMARLVHALPNYGPARMVLRQAPVLIIPNVLPREFCRHLIGLYDADGGEDSGYMTERDGKTVGVIDYSHKRRRDYLVQEEPVKAALRHAINRRVAPEIRKAFNFEITRLERYLVACYDAATGGYFRPHRDNTTKGTAHRMFAMSLNLNAEEYEGGDLRFPEYGLDTYRAPTGGAVVFSCSLMHEATPVTKGRRYAFLPFFYNEAGDRIRQANLQYLADGAAKPATPAPAPAEEPVP
ncbi:MAG TPA: 2OG-Fe(II) oxygenase [Alphaproteobacteria bacterium]|nr:2OG-Fe(II) oxygenase [Alphaproteobacteria bacterium]